MVRQSINIERKEMAKKVINHTPGDEKENTDILINVLLDRSGSMNGRETDTIGNFNSLIAEQKKIPGKVLVSLTQFDDVYEEVYVGKDINEVPKLTSSVYFVRGMTALLDAVGKLIARVDALKDKPEKILFVINTDGQENSSREFNFAKIKELVTERRDNHGWEFLFIGAGLDAFSQGSQMGFNAGQTFTASNSAAGSANTYSYVNSVTSTLRSTGSRGQALYDDAIAVAAIDFVPDPTAPDTLGQSVKNTKKKKVTASK